MIRDFQIPTAPAFRCPILRLVGGLLLLTVSFRATAMGGGAMQKMKETVRERFPNVPQISTQQLAAWLGDRKRAKPLLLDVREPGEFRVSHLPGAVLVDPSAKAADLRPLLAAGRPIVTYCSVGYRSSRLTERLQKAGVAKVSNLEGSIFEWANEGRPLEANGHAATRVHPYNAQYGRLLNEDRRAAVK